MSALHGGALWIDSPGFGEPVFASAIPPWHPLGALAPFLPAELRAVTLVVLATGLAGVAVAVLLPRRLAWFLACTAAVALTGWLAGPGAAIAVLGVALVAVVFERMVRSGSRAWFGILYLVSLVAALGTPGLLLGALFALPVGLALRLVLLGGVRLAPAIGGAAAILLGVSTGLPWLLPAREAGRQVRALDPVRGSITRVEGARVLRLDEGRSDPFVTHELGALRPLAIDRSGTWRLDSPVLDLAGVQAFEDGGARRLNEGAMPHVRLASDVTVEPDLSRSLLLLEEQVAGGAGTVVNHVPSRLAGSLPAGLAPGAWTRMAGGRLAATPAGARVASSGWNLLVTTHPWWPGWRAYWNGARQPPVVVNAAFVGAFVPPGDGTLTLRYRPDSLDGGIRAGGVALLAAALTLFWPWYRKIEGSWREPALVATARARVALLSGALAQPRVATALLLLGLGAYLALLVAFRSDVAGGADSSGYLHQSRLWLSGIPELELDLPRHLRLPHELDFAFVPLGFSPGLEPGRIVANYPPGLPLHMALARLLGGEQAVYLIAPILSAGCLLLLFVLARHLGATRLQAAACAAVLAACATFVFEGVQPMSDVPATFWALVAILSAFRSDRGRGWAVLAGAAVGVGLLVRPSQVLLVPAVVIAMRFHWRPVALAALGGLPFAAVQMAIAQRLWGDPFSTGYGDVGWLFAAENFVPRLRHYGYWLGALLTPLVFPLGLLGAASRRADPFARAALLVWFASFFAFYCFYQPYDTWWMTRFLLPAIPPLILLALILWREMAARAPVHALPAGMLVVAVILTVAVWQVRDKGALRVGEGERSYLAGIEGIDRIVPRKAVIVGMQMSGSLFYYRGRTMLRYDFVSRDQFELVRAHAFLAGRPVWAAVMDFEVPELRRRLPGRWERSGQIGSVLLFRLAG